MKIEKNIDRPKLNQGRLKQDEISETIFAMEVGDSVFHDDYDSAKRFRDRGDGYLRRNVPNFNSKLSIRAVDEKAGKGWRVWRIK